MTKIVKNVNKTCVCGVKKDFIICMGNVLVHVPLELSLISHYKPVKCAKQDATNVMSKNLAKYVKMDMKKLIWNCVNSVLIIA